MVWWFVGFVINGTNIYLAGTLLAVGSVACRLLRLVWMY